MSGLSSAPQVFLTAKSIIGNPTSAIVGGKTIKLRVKENDNGTVSLRAVRNGLASAIY
ncbi:MAG: hypothetical protein II840_10785 [Kiritimatiellae bacterium]|nr:hypothetical protein [Kiritimatiellia bacterium]